MAFLIVIAILLLGYLLLVRPSRKRQRRHQEMQDAVEVEDEVITAGGIHGIVRATEGPELRIEIAPGVVVTLDRRAVAAVAVREAAGPPEPNGPPELKQSGSEADENPS
jgi:preprotein translocase subunit YajC